MNDKVVFHLASAWRMVNGRKLYDQIKDGTKTSEWRDATPYWFRRLLRSGNLIINTEETLNLSRSLKVHTAWFVQGYPKDNLPRLEAKITEIYLHGEIQQFEVKFTNVKEVSV